MCTVQIKLSLAEASERKWSEVEIPDAVVDLFHSDVLPGEDVADAEAGLIGPLAPVALESYASCLANAPDFEVAGVLHLRELRGVVAIGCGVARRGRFVVERLVRTLVVVLGTKAVKLALLATEVGCWRARGFLLERSVKALMATILLRRRGLNEFRPNAQTNPPNLQARETGDGLCGEGHSIVGANDLWETVLTKELGKYRLGGLVFRREQGATLKGKAAASVVDR